MANDSYRQVHDVMDLEAALDFPENSDPMGRP
jgi:hypothetical protein